MDMQGGGFVVWFTGMNRAGKSTLASLVAQRLAAAGRHVELLDESGEAALLLEGLGASKDDRAKAVHRLGFVARAVMKAGGVAVCAALSPSRDARERLRKELRRFAEVFVDCTMEKLQERDAQGLYKKAFAGELKDVPGVDVPYEPPAHAEVTLHTEQQTIEACVTQVFQALVDAKLVGPAEFGRITGGQKPKRARPAKAPRRDARKKPARTGGPRKASLRVAARSPKPAKRRR